MAGNVIQWLQVPNEKVEVSKNQIDQAYMDSVLDMRVKDALGKMEADFREKLGVINKKVEEKNYDALKQIVDDSNRKMEIIERLDEIIAQLEELKTMKEGKEKNEKLSLVKKDFEALVPTLEKYGIEKEVLYDNKKGVVTWMDNSIARSNTDKSKGHYNAIIKKIDEYKDQIRKSE